MSVDEELAKKVFEEEQARFNAEHEARFKAEQEQERIDIETKKKKPLGLQKQLVIEKNCKRLKPFYVAEVRKNMCLSLRIKESSKPVKEEIVQQDDVIAEQAVKESSRTGEGRRKKSLARKKSKKKLYEEIAKKQKLKMNIEKEELKLTRTLFQKKKELILNIATQQDVLELYRLVKERFQTASPEGYDLLLLGDLKTMMNQMKR
ncbi:hypothetical protein Tco_0431407 [Tanacetum coccineum]